MEGSGVITNDICKDVTKGIFEIGLRRIEGLVIEDMRRIEGLCMEDMIRIES